MISLFRRTEYMDFGSYMNLVEKLDDIYFMDMLAKKRLKV